MLAAGDITTSKLLKDLHAARAETDQLFGILKDSALYERPIAERHRVIFYIGHLDGFDSILICREGLGLKSPDAALDSLFQAGIDPDSAHLPTDTPADWPSLDQVNAYVRRCRKHVDGYFEHAPEDSLQMAIEHRLMHLETLAYMFHNFSYELKNAPLRTGLLRLRESAPSNDWREIPGGEAILGTHDRSRFAWDNEFGEVRATIPAFRIQRFSVTNSDYSHFVDDGAEMPHFWIRRGHALKYRGMFEEIDLPPDWPVYVTHDQAQAYAAWLGKALPSEAQFHRAAFGTPGGQNRLYPWGDTPPTREHGNFDFKRWDPEPVDATPQGDSAFGVSQMVGNGWEWTDTRFAPFPGFRPHPSYPGYSSNFFDDEHYVMKGGSARTAARLLRRSFRNWFRRDYPYMYATFRCVEN